MHYRVIPLAEVDQTDETYRITTRGEIEGLKTSIASDGLISPPVLVKKQQRFIIVSGFRRCAACRQLDWRDIPAALLEPDPGPLACLRLAIAANALQRELNLIETARCLEKLAACLKDRQQVTAAAQDFGLPANPGMIDKLIGLCRLPALLQEAVLDGTLAFAAAVELGKLNVGDAIIFCKMFQQLRPSLNKQREIITAVREIARRENTDIEKILQDAQIRAILDDDRRERGRKVRDIRSLLYGRRYPAVSKVRRRFAEYVKDLGLAPGIQLTAPPNFEATTYTLQLSFDNLEELKSFHRSLERIIDHPSMKRIIARDALDDE